ncbi:unnamed protein product [Lota lota]
MPSMQGPGIPSDEDNAPGHCFTPKDEFTALTNPAVVETFFHVTHILGETSPRPAGPKEQLSIDQYRLVSHRLVLEWALKGDLAVMCGLCNSTTLSFGDRDRSPGVGGFCGHSV